jgi:hypothetical protein
MEISLRHSLVIVALCLISVCAYAAESDVSEGYDENTALTVKGTVLQVMTGQRGPVMIVLKTVNKDYTVITAPPRFLEQEGISFEAGALYEIKGSKYIGRDGTLYLIAGRLKNLVTGKVTLLRDEDNRPLWSGGHHRMRRGHNQ